MEGVPGTMVIQPGQHILIEGEDDDNPYVARVLQLFGDGESLAGGCTTTPKRWWRKATKLTTSLYSQLKKNLKAGRKGQLFYRMGFWKKANVAEVVRKSQTSGQAHQWRGYLREQTGMRGKPHRWPHTVHSSWTDWLMVIQDGHRALSKRKIWNHFLKMKVLFATFSLLNQSDVWFNV